MLDEISDAEAGRQRHQQMNMILNTTKRNHLYLQFGTLCSDSPINMPLYITLQ